MDSDNFHPPAQRLCLYFLSFYEKNGKEQKNTCNVIRYLVVFCDLVFSPQVAILLSREFCGL